MKYTFVMKPYPHQRRALKRLLRQQGGGLQVPMRWGKTKVAVDFVNCMALKHGLRRVLVVCPLSVIGVWHEQIDLHTPQMIEEADLVKWRVINYEQTYDRYSTGKGSWVDVDSKALKAFAPELIIVDESHRIGNPSTLTNKHLCALGRKARWRVIMTGTMFHRKPFFVFGQAKFYDPGIFGGNYGNFKERIAIMGGHGGFEVIRWRNLKWMVAKMKRFVVIEKEVEGVPPVTRPLYFNLKGVNLVAYREMARESVLQLKNGEVLISPIVIARHLRCCQIAGGHVKTETGYHRVGTDKARMGADRLQEYADSDIKKVVIGCVFRPELLDAAKAARAAGYRICALYGGMTAEQRTAAIARFRTNTVPTAMVCQISAGKEGIDLSEADTMLFWSIDRSFANHDQFTKRIWKYGETRTLQYDFLIAKGTRDEVNYEATKLQKDVVDFLVEYPLWVEEITAKLSKPLVLK